MLLGQSLGLKKNTNGEEDEEADERLNRKMWEKRRRERDAKQIEKTIESLKIERQRLANFYCNVQNESEKLQEVTSLIVDDYDKTTQNNDVNIKSGLNKQKERLRKRLEQKSKLEIDFLKILTYEKDPKALKTLLSTLVWPLLLMAEALSKNKFSIIEVIQNFL